MWTVTLPLVSDSLLWRFAPPPPDAPAALARPALDLFGVLNNLFCGAGILPASARMHAGSLHHKFVRTPILAKDDEREFEDDDYFDDEEEDDDFDQDDQDEFFDDDEDAFFDDDDDEDDDEAFEEFDDED